MLTVSRAALVLIALGGGSAALAAPSIEASKTILIGLGETSRVKALVVLGDGDALYAIADGDDVVVRAVSAGGRVGPAKTVSTAGRTKIAGVSMATLNNGNVAVAWTASPGQRPAVFARVINPSGDAVSSEQAVSGGGLASADNVAAARLAAGGFAIAWRDSRSSGATSLEARAFDADGARRGAPGRIRAPEGISFSSFSVAPYGQGFLMVYAQKGAEDGVIARPFSRLAKPADSPIRLDEPNGRAHENPQIVGLLNRDYAVVWQENAYSSGKRPAVVDTALRGRFVLFDTRPAARFEIEDPISAKSLERSPALVDTAAGLLVAWRISTTKSDGRRDDDVRGAFVARSGAVGAPAPLAKRSASPEGALLLGRRPDGQPALGFDAFEPGDADRYDAAATFPKVAE